MKQLLFFMSPLLAVFTASAGEAASRVVPSERVTRNVVVRTAPSTHSSPIEGLAPGEAAILLDEVPGWYRVQLPDGRTGYVSKSWTVLVDEEGTVPSAIGTGPFKIHVIDVGTGLAVLIQGPGFTMLYDGGSQDDLASGPDNRILAYIKAVAPTLQTIDHLVLSHPHKDHLELLPDVFDKYSVRNVWDSGRVNKTRGYCRFLKKVEAEPGVLYHNAIATGGLHQVVFTSGGCTGTVRIAQAAQMSAAPVSLGAGAQMTILYRDALPHSDPNENTLVIRLDLGSRRILLAGDAEGGERALPVNPPQPQSIEGKLVACCRAELKADVLVVGHHGSLTSSRRSFLDAVNASVFVISSGPHPYSSVVLPDREITEELGARGQVMRTDLEDELCEVDQAKIGPDSDESPGGCKNVLVSIGPGGDIAASYNEISD